MRWGVWEAGRRQPLPAAQRQRRRPQQAQQITWLLLVVRDIESVAAKSRRPFHFGGSWGAEGRADERGDETEKAEAEKMNRGVQRLHGYNPPARQQAGGCLRPSCKQRQLGRNQPAQLRRRPRFLPPAGWGLVGRAWLVGQHVVWPVKRPVQRPEPRSEQGWHFWAPGVAEKDCGRRGGGGRQEERLGRQNSVDKPCCNVGSPVQLLPDLGSRPPICDVHAVWGCAACCSRMHAAHAMPCCCTPARLAHSR